MWRFKMRIYRYVKITGSPSTASGVSPQNGSSPAVTSTHIAGNYVERVISLIPAEVVIIYPLLDALLRGTPDVWLGKTVAGVCSVFLTAFLRLVIVPKKARPQFSAVCVSTIACLIWIYHQGGYILFPITEGYQNYATGLLIVFVVASAPFIKGEVKAG